MNAMRLDDRIESYRSFLDYPWVREIDKLTSGTVLDGPTFVLFFNWKAMANAYAMPFLMMQMLKNLEEGHLRQRPGVAEHAIRTLEQQLPARMGKEHGLSHMKQKQLSEMISGMIDGVELTKRSMPTLDPQELFHTFLFGPGGSELQLAVFGLSETCFGNLLHAYDNFVTSCIGIAKGKPDYRAFSAKTIEKDVRAEFGDKVAEYCLTDAPVQVARSVRNALIHNGGKLDPNFEKPISDIIRQQFFIEQGRIHIVADNVRRLFNELKQRVQKLVEKAFTMPQFKASGVS